MIGLELESFNPSFKRRQLRIRRPKSFIKLFKWYVLIDIEDFENQNGKN
jgi:hypothetical protein